ncbi:MAG: hypothetical protein ACREAB_17575 [Blastocatellia bacterium]
MPETFAGNPVMSRPLGGWELSAITTLASGTPLKRRAARLFIKHPEREKS